MKNVSQMALVDFQGTKLLTMHDGVEARVAIRSICEALGIDWSGQLAKIKADPVLSEGVGLSPTPSQGGMQDTVTLPLGMLQGWLFKIHPNKVRPEARETVLAFQRECYQVLHDYWTKGAAINPRMTQALPSATSDIIKLIEAVKREANESARVTLHQLLDQMCTARGVVTPPLEKLTPTRDDLSRERAQFWSAFEKIEAAGEPINLHRRADMIAVNLPMMRRMMEKHRIGAPAIGQRLYAALRSDERFAGNKMVNCQDDQFRQCWLFWAAPVEPDLFAN